MKVFAEKARVRRVDDPAVFGTVDEQNDETVEVEWDDTGCIGSVPFYMLELIPTGEDVPTKRLPKPCPLCDKEVTFVKHVDMVDNYDHSYELICTECGVHVAAEMESELLELWNNRPLNPGDKALHVLSDVEAAAERVYDKLVYDGPLGTVRPKWVPGGNSEKQDEARRYARAALGV